MCVDFSTTDCAQLGHTVAINIDTQSVITGNSPVTSDSGNNATTPSLPDLDISFEDNRAPPRRKGGRKPIYATAEERKQRNRQAQAAFRERRNDYVKRLESTIEHNESIIGSLRRANSDASHHSAWLTSKVATLEQKEVSMATLRQALDDATRQSSWLTDRVVMLEKALGQTGQGQSPLSDHKPVFDMHSHVQDICSGSDSLMPEAQGDTSRKDSLQNQPHMQNVHQTPGNAKFRPEHASGVSTRYKNVDKYAADQQRHRANSTVLPMYANRQLQHDLHQYDSPRSSSHNSSTRASVTCSAESGSHTQHEGMNEIDYGVSQSYVLTPYLSADESVASAAAYAVHESARFGNADNGDGHDYSAMHPQQHIEELVKFNGQFFSDVHSPDGLIGQPTEDSIDGLRRLWHH